jgi:hypothetical protein
MGRTLQTGTKRQALAKDHLTANLARLSKIMPKVWYQVDYYLSEANQNEEIRRDIVLALLKKALPNNLNLNDLNKGQGAQILIINGDTKTQISTNGKAIDIKQTATTDRDKELASNAIDQAQAELTPAGEAIVEAVDDEG